MGRILDQIIQNELESILYEIDYHGYVEIPLQKLYRLLGKGNRAAGTWKALLDAWEEIDGDRDALHIVELIHEKILITNKATASARLWSDEVASS